MKLKAKAFISGPIQGVEARQSYRERISEICVRCGYEPVDPWKREKILYRGAEYGWWEKVPAADFVKRDLEDIEKCSVLIAYLPRLSAGTCMELFYAKMKGKKTICICSLKNPSPWITVHSDMIISKIGELENALKTINTR
ncbi:MAG: nucleoside 2-deoxyribosyltransferase [Candidatus Bathyarchaeales archaeon]